MKTKAEIEKALDDAQKEIQKTCTKFGVTLINNGRLSLVLYDGRKRVGETHVAFAPF